MGTAVGIRENLSFYVAHDELNGPETHRTHLAFPEVVEVRSVGPHGIACFRHGVP
jgi:hypothetical protein